MHREGRSWVAGLRRKSAEPLAQLLDVLKPLKRSLVTASSTRERSEDFLIFLAMFITQLQAISSHLSRASRTAVDLCN